MCHRGHRADTDPLVDVGLKDITAHVDFSGSRSPARTPGSTSSATRRRRASFSTAASATCSPRPARRARSDALKLVHEHEMGELFKVLAFAKGATFAPIGFASGDRRHRL